MLPQNCPSPLNGLAVDKELISFTSEDLNEDLNGLIEKANSCPRYEFREQGTAQLTANIFFGRARLDSSYVRRWRLEPTRAPATFHHPFGGRCSRAWAHWVDTWLLQRLGSRADFVTVAVFSLASASHSVVLYNKGSSKWDDNPISLVVVSNILSLAIALVISLVMERREAIAKIFCWHRLWRFLIVSLLFTMASICVEQAYELGCSPGHVFTIGYIYLPLAAILSLCIFKRRYGTLEWLSLGIITFSVISFISLRSQGISNVDAATNTSVALIGVSCICSALASILAERIYKDRSAGIRRVNNRASSLSHPSAEMTHTRSARSEVVSSLELVEVPSSSPAEVGAPRGSLHTTFDGSDSSYSRSNGATTLIVPQLSTRGRLLAGTAATEHADAFYIHKVHLDWAALLFSCIPWIISVAISDDRLPMLEHQDYWFGTWGSSEVTMVLSIVFQGWFAGLVTKRFSTVARSVLESCLRVILIFGRIPIMGDKRFQGGLVPCALLTTITLASAVIFQTGRLNLARLRENFHLGEEQHAEISWAAWCGRYQDLSCDAIRGPLVTYAAVIVFVLSDTGRTLSQQLALSKSMITPQSMVLFTFLAGVAIATVMTMWKDGLKGLKQAYNPRSIIAYFPAAFLFALASTLLAMAYAAGVNAAVCTALGYVYMPISALASRCFFDKYYIWVEWFGLIILTFASALFGFLNNFYAGSAGQENSVLAMVLVVASACTSVFASLSAEKVLKNTDETVEDLPFHVQKVGLDIGSAVITFLLFFVIGGISTRPQDAFWKQRPLDHDCQVRMPSNMTCASPDCICECGSGIFVAWGDLTVIIALLINVLQGWLTGVVIKQFSTVLRAIAQSSTILAIYFVGDPVLNPDSVRNWVLTLVAFVVPLSTALFMTAAAEMEKVMTLAVASLNPRLRSVTC